MLKLINEDKNYYNSKTYFCEDTGTTYCTYMTDIAGKAYSVAIDNVWLGALFDSRETLFEALKHPLEKVEELQEKLKKDDSNFKKVITTKMLKNLK